MIVNPPQNVRSFASGNLVGNAGFETGALSPWYINAGSVTISAVNPHAGTYCAQVHGGGGDMRQTLNPPIPVNAITECSFYVRQTVMSLLQSVWYSDGTYTLLQVDDTSGNWLSENVTASLTAGKLVTQLEFSGRFAGDNFIDDVVLNAPRPRSTVLLTYPPQS